HEGGAVAQDDLERQQGPDEGDDRRAGKRAGDRAVAAENRAAADDDGGDRVEFAQLSGGGNEASIERVVDDAGARRADRGDEQGGKADAPCVDAGEIGGPLIAADRIDLLAEGGASEHDGGYEGDQENEYGLDAH